MVKAIRKTNLSILPKRKEYIKFRICLYQKKNVLPFNKTELNYQLVYNNRSKNKSVMKF